MTVLEAKARDAEMAALGAHLATRRAAILHAWRALVRKDPMLTSGDALPRHQLNDHIPAVLAAFEHQLGHRAENEEDVAAGAKNAAAHGLHRWQQGYDLHEVVRELANVNALVTAEIDAYAAAPASPTLPATLAAARQRWAEVFGRAIEESTVQFFHLQRTEAVGHLKDLEKALDDVRELEQQRAELWREAAHDLRGNVGVVSNATAVLVRDVDEARRARFVRVLQRNVGSLHQLLDDVTDLARLQAGREKRQLSRFDVAALMVDLCEGLLPQAQERGLSLQWDGPAPFVVEGDAVKVRRLAQNLVLNAVKYTRDGGVVVRWGDGESGDAKRWLLRVADTGPGFQASGAAPLAGELTRATELARTGGESDAATPASTAAAPTAAAAPGNDDRPRGGEGIGLSIVKRLSELLDASVELDSAADVGTTFRVLLPRHYAAAPA